MIQPTTSQPVLNEITCGTLLLPRAAPEQLSTPVTWPPEIAVTIEEAHVLEANTRDQSKSVQWHQARAGRLTASTFGNILLKRTITPKFINNLKNPKKFTSKSTNHGLANEQNAKDKYIHTHPGTHMHAVGLVVNPAFPFLGATPDAKVCLEGAYGHSRSQMSLLSAGS